MLAIERCFESDCNGNVGGREICAICESGLKRTEEQEGLSIYVRKENYNKKNHS